MAGTTDILVLILADWRRLAAWLLGGWSIFALVLLMAVGYLGCHGCPPGTVSRFLSMKAHLFCLVYAMGPWAFSVHAVHRGTGLLAQLPLSRRDINRFMLFRGILLGVACLPMWLLVFRVLARFGMTAHPMLAVVVGLGLLAYQLFGMLTKVAGYAIRGRGHTGITGLPVSRAYFAMLLMELQCFCQTNHLIDVAPQRKIIHDLMTNLSGLVNQETAAVGDPATFNLDTIRLTDRMRNVGNHGVTHFAYATLVNGGVTTGVMREL